MPDAAQKLPFRKPGLPRPRDERAWDALYIGLDADAAGEEPIFFFFFASISPLSSKTPKLKASSMRLD